MIFVRESTLANEELNRWFNLSWTEAVRIASGDADFALWRASVNEDASPPAQNPGGLLLKKLLLFLRR